MLANSPQRHIDQLLEQIDCRIELPEEWRETFFTDQGAQPTSYDERRRHIRFNLRKKGVLRVCKSPPGVSRSQRLHVIYTCNIARSGVAFLHFEPLLPAEFCELWLCDRKLSVNVTHSKVIGPSCCQVGAEFTCQQGVDLARLIAGQG